MAGEVFTPDWPLQDKVWAAYTGRNGGLSRATYDSFNVGLHVGDDAAAVQGNRALLTEHMQRHCEPMRLAWLDQVHGTRALVMDAVPDVQEQADAVVTDQLGLACGVMVADCLPLLLASEDGAVVAAVHAGWRGLVNGVIESALDEAEQLLRRRSQWFAWIGPCISQAAFEVGPEVRAAFIAHDPQAVLAFVPSSKPNHWRASLVQLAQQRLQSRGLSEWFGNDGSQAWCTYSNPERYFSYRRDGTTGRMVVLIAKKSS